MISGHALFPAGFVGGGLLLLRLSVAISLLLLTGLDSANWCQFLAILGAIGLCAGLQTRGLAALSLAAPLLALVPALAPLTVVHVIDAVALALAGPGAWSADAIMFGRRKVILPDRDDTIV
jgi:hypothetical protein